MRLATFNIHHGTVGSKGPVDPDRLADVCAGFDADVLALQEVDRRTYRSGRVDLAAVVAERTGLQHVFGASRWFPGGRYGNALFVRGEIRSWSVVPLPKLPWWHVWQERRTAIVAHVEAGGIDLTVAATHLAVPHRVNGRQLQLLLEWVTAAGPLEATGPHIAVLGDLNRFPATVEPAARHAGLTYVDHGPTNPVNPKPTKAIDHVLVSPSLVATHTEVQRTAVSDHAALLVDVAPAATAEGSRAITGPDR